MYKLKLHKNLTEEKWRVFGKTKQLLMIANELNRAKNWIVKEDFEEVKHCYERAFELLDLTVSVSMSRNLIRELLRFREMLALQYIDKKMSVKFNNDLLKILLSLNSETYQIISEQI